jgi:hypothetical protein
MAILSGLFGSDSSSESGNSSDLLGILDGSLGVDASNTSYEQSVDDDGSSETSFDQTSFGADLDIGSLLSNMTDGFNSSDSDSGGGLFG